jgi:hypothetical protein
LIVNSNNPNPDNNNPDNNNVTDLTMPGDTIADFWDIPLDSSTQSDENMTPAIAPPDTNLDQAIAGNPADASNISFTGSPDVLNGSNSGGTFGQLFGGDGSGGAIPFLIACQGDRLVTESLDSNYKAIAFFRNCQSDRLVMEFLD